MPEGGHGATHLCLRVCMPATVCVWPSRSTVAFWNGSEAPKCMDMGASRIPAEISSYAE